MHTRERVHTEGPASTSIPLCLRTLWLTQIWKTHNTETSFFSKAFLVPTEGTSQHNFREKLINKTERPCCTLCSRCGCSIIKHKSPTWTLFTLTDTSTTQKITLEKTSDYKWDKTILKKVHQRIWAVWSERICQLFLTIAVSALHCPPKTTPLTAPCSRQNNGELVVIILLFTSSRLKTLFPWWQTK